MTYTADFTFKGLLRPLQPVLGLALARSFKKLGDEAEQGMREALASSESRVAGFRGSSLTLLAPQPPEAGSRVRR